MDKQILRNKYKKIRKNIKNKEELDKIIFNKIINLEEYKQSNLILTYVSLKEEVGTFKLIEHGLKNGKKIAVPRCEGDNIVFYNINGLEELEQGSFGILEPKTSQIITDFSKSICIIPGIVFDKENNRIGYGKGVYDKFLENYTGIKIGLTYKECMCETINSNKNDIKMDKVIFG